MSPIAKQKIGSFLKYAATAAVAVSLSIVLGEGLIWRGRQETLSELMLKDLHAVAEALTKHVDLSDRRYEEVQGLKTKEALTSQKLEQAVKVLEDILTEQKRQTAYGLKNQRERK